LGYKERSQDRAIHYSAIVRAISFQNFQPMWSDRETDGQTNDMRSQDRAIYYSASRGNHSSVV